MRISKTIQCLLIAIACLGLTLPGQAAMVGTAQMHGDLAQLDLADISVKRDWIRQQLVAGGVDAGLASTRVAAMTDAQVLEIHQRIDQMPAGGADALIIIILVLVITELMGYTDIIPNWPAE